MTEGSTGPAERGRISRCRSSQAKWSFLPWPAQVLGVFATKCHPLGTPVASTPYRGTASQPLISSLGSFNTSPHRSSSVLACLLACLARTGRRGDADLAAGWPLGSLLWVKDEAGAMGGRGKGRWFDASRCDQDSTNAGSEFPHAKKYI